MKVIFCILILFLTIGAEAADHYFIDGGVNNNWNTVGNWSATSGGSSNGTLPSSEDDCYLDANSPANSNMTANQYTGAVDCTGYTGTLTISAGVNWYPDGNITLVSGMTYNSSGVLRPYWGNTGITTAGHTFQGFYMEGNCTFLDAMTSNAQIYVRFMTTDFNDQTVSCTDLYSAGADSATLNMGAGNTITCTSATTAVEWVTSSKTLNEETSTLVLSNAGDFKGAGETWYNVTIGTAGGSGDCTITSSNTFNTLTVTKGNTATFTDGTDQNVTSFVATGDASDGITLTGTATGGWSISDTTGTNTVHYCTIDYSTAEGGATWDATDNCTDGGNNSGWTFAVAAPPPQAIIIHISKKIPDWIWLAFSFLFFIGTGFIDRRW